MLIDTMMCANPNSIITTRNRAKQRQAEEHARREQRIFREHTEAQRRNDRDLGFPMNLTKQPRKNRMGLGKLQRQ